MIFFRSVCYVVVIDVVVVVVAVLSSISLCLVLFFPIKLVEIQSEEKVLQMGLVAGLGQFTHGTEEELRMLCVRGKRLRKTLKVWMASV